MKIDNRITYASFIIVCICLFSCATDDDKGRGRQQREKKSLVVVLCDMSKSIQSRGASKDIMFDTMKSYVRQIPKSFAPGSVFFFFPVSENVVSKPLVSEFSYTENINQTIFRKQDSTVKVSVEKVIASIDNYSAITKQSCIFSSVCSATQFFSEKSAQYKPDEYDYRLIIISDMIENCLSSSGVSMHKSDTALLRKDLARFEKLRSPFNLENLKIHYTVLFNNPEISNPDVFSSLQKSWSKKFEQMNSATAEIRFNRLSPFQKSHVFNFLK